MFQHLKKRAASLSCCGAMCALAGVWLCVCGRQAASLEPSCLMETGTPSACCLEFCLRLFIFLFTNSTQGVYTFNCIDNGEAVRRSMYILNYYMDSYFLTMVRAREKKIQIQECEPVFPGPQKGRFTFDVNFR